METKNQITEKLSTVFAELTNVFKKADEGIFFIPYHNKWSIDGNLQHLIKSVKPLTRVLGGDKRIFDQWGKPEHSSVSYDEIKERYIDILNKTSPFNPKFAPEETPGIEKNKEIAAFGQANEELLESLKNWSTEELDSYQLPHPVLGLLTVREMLYFTIYHTWHHHKAVIAILENETKSV
jgi:hypothetical protein